MTQDDRTTLQDHPKVRRLKARQLRQRLALQHKLERESKPRRTWRDVAPVFWPYWFIGRPICKIGSWISIAGADADRLLERPIDELLCKSERSRFQDLLLRSALWLTTPPNDAPEPDEEDEGELTREEVGNQSFVSESEARAFARMRRHFRTQEGRP